MMIRKYLGVVLQRYSSIYGKYLAAALVVLACPCAMVYADQPNIVMVMTDDQGYGDLGRHRNPALSTPNLDQLADESVRFTNFHMDPTCSPSRAALMTGKHSMNAGVWHTIMGRSLMATEHTTMPEALQKAGYKTAMFGKWHLGDNYPFRPQDQGFDEVLIHGGGGVGQTPDVWGNTQFEDTYYHNGELTHFEEFATTVWFDGAIDFIRQSQDQPFFAYISTNAPHSPWRAPDEYAQLYLDMGLPEDLALFYAMITQLDDQVGRLRDQIDEMGITDNTIFIFMTDNGSAMSTAQGTFANPDFDRVFAELTSKPGLEDWVYNYGMRGFKATVYEGGHRVPLYVHWPDGDLGKPRDEDYLSAHFDLMPTLLELADAEAPDGLDGVSLTPLLQEKGGLESRELVVTNQRVDIPSEKRPSTVMTDRWRYVLHGEQNLVELFDIQADPSQANDVSSAHPQVVEQLQATFDQWWVSVTKDGFPRQRIIVGNDAENPARLTSMDWMEAQSTDDVPWFPGFQRPQDKRHGPSWINREERFKSLPWYLQVDQSGNYRVSLYLRDKQAAYPVERKYAVLEVDGERQVAEIRGIAGGANFDLPLSEGNVVIEGWFTDSLDSDEGDLPAFFAYVERMD